MLLNVIEYFRKDLHSLTCILGSRSVNFTSVSKKKNEIKYKEMAEKGGNVFSFPTKVTKVGRPSLKSVSPNDGKDSSAKPKKGKKVQFDAQVSMGEKFNFASGGKADSAPSKGDWGAGGKGDKQGNSARSPVAKEPQPLELKIEQELPKNIKCQCLMDCEATQILLGVQEQMVVLSADPSIKIPISFDRGLQYAKRGTSYRNPQNVRKILETLKKHGVSDSEICVIANICPENPDEVFALVPSLKAKRSKLQEPVKDVLIELTKLKESP